MALQETEFSFTDTLPDGTTLNRDFSILADGFTAHGTLTSDKNAGQFILDNSVETKGMTMDGINEKPRRFVATSKEFTSDIKDGIAYYGL